MTVYMSRTEQIEQKWSDIKQRARALEERLDSALENGDAAAVRRLKKAADEIFQEKRALEDAEEIRRQADELLPRSGAEQGFGGSVVAGGFDLKHRPSVEIPLREALVKAPTLPAVGDWNRAAPTLVPMGRDERFLSANLVQENVSGETSISDFRQTARVVTGSVQRSLDAVSDKAALDVTITLVTENLVQMAVIIPDVPNAALESVRSLTQFLDQEGRYQVNKALDAHAMSQIVAASPPFGTSGADLIARIRNGVASMRAEGASPSIVALNPSDAASLDLSSDAGGYVFPTRDSGSGSPLWGLRVVERIGAGNEAPYLIDPAMLGVFYMGMLHFAADPYSSFRKNLTTLRLEMRALMHIRNAKGARRIAAS